MKKRSFTTAAVIAVIAAGWYFKPAAIDTVILDRSAQPEVVQEMQQFQQIRLNSQGRAIDNLSGKSLQQMQDGSSQIQAPEIKSSQGWLIQADIAQIEPSSDEFTLSGNVVMSSTKDFGSALKTEQLRYLQQQQRAQTDKEVTISGDQYRLAGQGMRIDLEAGTMQLLANTRGRYEISGNPVADDSTQPTSRRP
ncbi:LPS export ABC transporter periplasmic protein LptC [Pelagibaculum spongiae]|uniref:LPS export ABC transporter periplasmic protein LptC n=1 Tax=Pelagibaculum spongiae TaxID=2080658 RepID=A0A2V1GZQ3_9GAMM|nr:LPS export ABC transporter periplasmic protein LptC [Pelagibaculum spongiae]PVZ71919.1 LPS export ABC transporter periplasmic protein LptC [Pelagibaculum spongiae]